VIVFLKSKSENNGKYMSGNEHGARLQENEVIRGECPSFRGIYLIGLASTAIGIGVIIFLNLATPLEYLHGRLIAPDQPNGLSVARQLAHIFNLAFLLLLSCPPLLFFIRYFLKPVSDYFNSLSMGQESKDLLKKARQSLINLPLF